MKQCFKKVILATLWEIKWKREPKMGESPRERSGITRVQERDDKAKSQCPTYAAGCGDGYGIC
jgi:hypothetical protein